MIEIVLFVLGAVALLAWLGHTGTPPAERLGWRSWTPVHVMDLARRGVKVLIDGGKERQRRAEAASRNARGPQRPPPRDDSTGPAPRP